MHRKRGYILPVSDSAMVTVPAALSVFYSCPRIALWRDTSGHGFTGYGVEGLIFFIYTIKVSIRTDGNRFVSRRVGPMAEQDDSLFRSRKRRVFASVSRCCQNCRAVLTSNHQFG